METAPLKSFATKARIDLLKEVGARVLVVLAENSLARVESAGAVRELEEAIARDGQEQVVDRVAHTWFNRIIALRFMDANGYTASGVVSPGLGRTSGQPEVFAEAKAGTFDDAVVSARTQALITSLLNGTRLSSDAQGEAYGLLLEAYCRHWHKAMPFMFEREGDYTELLMPTALLAADSVRDRAVRILTEDVCREVEVIGWLYQFYISDRKDEVFDGFKKNKKAGAAEIPAATQLFTPHWIVRYLVENSLGRLWLLNNPSSRLAEQMDYYIKPVDEETDFLKIAKPEELKVIDPAVGSGHMLTYAFDLLYAIYTERGYDPAEIPGLILQHNLYGTEIDPRAGALAAFALTMKAAARRRLFLKNPAQPNIRVLENVLFDPAELDYLWSLTKADGFARADADEFWNAFEHADTFGSLIQPKEQLIAPLAAAIEGVLGDGDLLHGRTLEKAAIVVEQAEYLSQQYLVAVMNPPYMGSRNFSAAMSQWAGERYPETRTDLFAMFIQRCLELIQSRGLVSMITMETWMFIRSFEELRRILISATSIRAVAHLGSHAFDSIAGELVGTVAFVLSNVRPSSAETATFLRVVQETSEAAKSGALRRLASDYGSEGRFKVPLADLAALPGVPLAYWLPDGLRTTLAKSTGLGAVIDFPSSAHKTGDNKRFLRKWWEVSRKNVDVDGHWVPYAKGGGARRWYGLVQDVVDWSPSALQFYRQNSSSALMNRNSHSLAGVTYSMLTMGANTFRVLPPGYAYDMGGPGFFPVGLTLEQTLAIVNSDMTETVLGALNPTINLQTRDVKQIPFPSFSDLQLEVLHVQATRAIEIATASWASNETALEFERPAVVGGAPLMSGAVAGVKDAIGKAVHEMDAAEGAINSTIWEAIGVDPVLYSNHRGRKDSSGASPEDRSTAEIVAGLVSYAVGCMFGRYSLDKLGLVLADQGSTLEGYLAQVPSPSFMPDRDNVIPIVDGDWFEDDIVARFRQFLRAAFGDEHFEENLRFVAESLGVKDIRDYWLIPIGGVGVGV